MYEGNENVKVVNMKELITMTSFMVNNVETSRLSFSCAKEKDFPIIVYTSHSRWGWDEGCMLSGDELSCEDFMYKYNTASFVQEVGKKLNKYSREIKKGVYVDVYDVLNAFDVKDPCLQHMIKKCLANGVRGHKDATEDYSDIVASANRALELHLEWKDSK